MAGMTYAMHPLILEAVEPARSRDSSISSGVTVRLPASFGLPLAAAFTQLRKVCSTSPNSLATTPAVSPAFTRFTARSLNSGVNTGFGIFISSLPK